MAETRRRFQFGLRKLLLWTVVLALYLGVARMLGMPPIALAVLTLWIAVVAGLRAAFGPVVAAIVSPAIGAVLGGWFEYTGPALDPPGPSPLGPGIALGGLFGCVLFAAVELSCRAVNWADNVMRTRHD